jgi:hypothetical protein
LKEKRAGQAQDLHLTRGPFSGFPLAEREISRDFRGGCTIYRHRERLCDKRYLNRFKQVVDTLR